MKNINRPILESYDNKVVQVLSLFSVFLFTLTYNVKNEILLNTVFVDASRVYIRALVDFFKNQRSHNDDLIYRDFINTNLDLSINMSVSFRNEINKQTAHLTVLRGTFNVNDSEYEDMARQIVSSITEFMNELGVQNIKEKYKAELEDDFAVELINTVLAQLLIIKSINS